MSIYSFSRSTEHNRPVALWLFACCAMVFATLVVGGVTRLTHSGLSIVEWQPLIGALPPFNEADWQTLFAKYQATPEFQLKNHDMTMDGFQYIFWWEWAHRLIGRTIGVVFFVPFVWFWIRGRIPGGYKLRLLGFFFLGGLQGAMGWYMVKSGLVDDPRVSQYRLTAHLGLAFLIFSLMFWTALGLLRERIARPSAPTALRRFAAWVAVLVFVMVLSGGLVAGTHAGLTYNTFPLMNGAFIPPDIMAMDPWWLNFFSNLTTIQFDHRMIAWALMLFIPILWWRVIHAAPVARGAANAMLAMLVVQVTLGVSTLLHHVPVSLGAMHQAGAMILLAKVLWVNHKLRIV